MTTVHAYNTQLNMKIYFLNLCGAGELPFEAEDRQQMFLRILKDKVRKGRHLHLTFLIILFLFSKDHKVPLMTHCQR
jgi:hypothetical protein